MISISYVKQTWVDRLVQYAKRFTYAQDATYLTLTPAPGTITAAGSAVDASRLNHMEAGIEEGSLGVNTGWVATYAGAYVSADAPTFVFRVNQDVTGIYQPGMRVKLTQTTTKYFIVTAVGAYSGGYTSITVYGGTDYTLTSATITDLSISLAKAPFGFPLNPAKWTVEALSASQLFQTAPTSGTWYNLGALGITLPIGIWRTSYQMCLQNLVVAAGVSSASITLSTANNSEIEPKLTGFNSSYGNAVNVGTMGVIYRELNIVLAAKTVYYMLARANDTNCSYIEFRGDFAMSIIRAVCAYL